MRSCFAIFFQAFFYISSNKSQKKIFDLEEENRKSNCKFKLNIKKVVQEYLRIGVEIK